MLRRCLFSRSGNKRSPQHELSRPTSAPIGLPTISPHSRLLPRLALVSLSLFPLCLLVLCRYDPGLAPRPRKIPYESNQCNFLVSIAIGGGFSSPEFIIVGHSVSCDTLFVQPVSLLRAYRKGELHYLVKWEESAETASKIAEASSTLYTEAKRPSLRSLSCNWSMGATGDLAFGPYGGQQRLRSQAQACVDRRSYLTGRKEKHRSSTALKR